jgi:EAL domain-containing protein (putative c-di-GMP-specific phosphodiesterase class I)/FixJ family two-component response regulator
MTASPGPGDGERLPRRPRILLVDDETSVLAALHRQLRGEYDVVTTPDPVAGLELMARHGPFDVVISDMRMPVMDGAAFLTRARGIARDTTRVLLTGDANINTAIAAVNDGQIFRFLSKPCPGQTLRQCLRDAVDHHHCSTAAHEIIDQLVAGPAQAMPVADAQTVAELAAAFRASQLSVWYQPVIDLGTGQIAGTEALIRWQHPEQGVLLPDQFMAAAERGGLIVPIGRWVLQRACQDAAAWPAGQAGPVPVAVNLHADQLRDPRLTDDVRCTLSGSGLAADRLTLEVIESVLLHDVRSAAQTLARFRDMGVSIAVDDFGTGYSSLSYLHNLPVDILKIDRAFIASLPESTPAAVTQAIVQLATALGLKTVAEGIETDTQLRACRELGCQRGQGFLFAEPMPDASLKRVLSTQNTAQPAGPTGG